MTTIHYVSCSPFSKFLIRQWLDSQSSGLGFSSHQLRCPVYGPRQASHTHARAFLTNKYNLIGTSIDWEVNRHTVRRTGPLSIPWPCSFDWCLAEDRGIRGHRRHLGYGALE